MISKTVQLARDLHKTLGYPFGKIHYRMTLLGGALAHHNSPLRHVRKYYNRGRHLKEVLERRRNARNFIGNLAPGIAHRAEEFRKNGFTYFTEQIDPQLLAELMRYYDEVISKRSATATAPEHHPFFFPLTDDKDFTTDNILVRFALQDSVIQAVTAFFGCVPFLSGIYINESRHVKIKKKSQLASQQWHLDFSASGDELVSLWVYLTPVESLDQGPFTYLPTPASRKVKSGIFPRRVEDEEIEAAGLGEQIEHAMGPRSTTFFVDTLRCYHMGSRVAPGEKRVACMFTYAKPATEQSFVKVTDAIPENKRLVLCRP